MSFASPPRPYPPSRYAGADGEVSAVLRRPDADHDLLMTSGWTDYLATGSSTGGDFGLYRWHMSGPRSGPDPHFHRTVSESFFVISGTVRLHDGSEWIDGHPGDFLYVPPGGIHGFRNESGEPAEMLILFTPGGPRERYFEGLVEAAQLDPRPDHEAMAEFFLEHDNFWVE